MATLYALLTTSLPNGITEKVSLFVSPDRARQRFAELSEYATEEEQDAAYEADDGGANWDHRFVIVECHLQAWQLRQLLTEAEQDA